MIVKEICVCNEIFLEIKDLFVMRLRSLYFFCVDGYLRKIYGIIFGLNLLVFKFGFVVNVR